MTDYKNLKVAMDQLGKDYILELTNQLISADKKASGNLIRSLRYEVIEVLNNILIRVYAADYLNVVDKGRKPGKMPPVSPIKKWMDIRGIRPGKKQTKEQLAFAIAKSIGQNGIRPTYVIKKSIDNILKTKKDLLGKAAAQDIRDQIKKIITEV
jgi:hypothetical protein